MWFVILVGTLITIGAGMLAPRMRRGRVTKRLAGGAKEVVDQAVVTVTGTIRAVGDLIEAPLSGRRGVVVQATAELPELDPHTTENVRLTTNWMVPFVLETAAGEILVDSEAADLELAPARVAPRSSEREQAFVREHGRGVEVAPVATFREIVLMPGMRVAVHGPLTIGWPRDR